MIQSDIQAVIQWWLVLFLLGTAFLPLTVHLFERFFDKGYIFAKLIGLAVSSYAIFVFGVLHILPFTILSCYVAFLLSAGAFYFLLPNKWKLRYALSHCWRIFLFEEIIFLTALFTWAYIHSFAPDIHGLEKYMDYGFINSILRATWFPPKDMWFPPYSINYYYFGHLMTAVLIRMSTIPANIGFNVMMSTIFAFCLTETFSIGANLYTFFKINERISKLKRFLSGALIAMLVTLAGNLHIIYSFFKPYATDNPLPPWQLQFLPFNFPNAYWYPNATRYIYHTIHEFPIYSWTVADLHGHVLDIPFVLLTIAFLLAIFISHVQPVNTEEAITEEKPRFTSAKLRRFLQFLDSFEVHPLLLVLSGFLLSIMYMTNAWDGAIYMLLVFFVILYIHWQKLPDYRDVYEKKEDLKVIKSGKQTTFLVNFLPAKYILICTRDVVYSMLFVIASFSVITFPYNIFFNASEIAHGVGVLCAPDFLTKIGKIGPFLFEPQHCQHSYWWELLILYGFFYFFVTVFLFYSIRSKVLQHVDMYILILIILSTLLIIIPEFVYLKDIYPAHYRANTMFKLVFQSFIMLSISSGYIFVRILSLEQYQKAKMFSPRTLFFIISSLLIILVMTYPVQAIGSYYGNLKNYRSLDGTAYLQTLYPSDYAAIEWLNATVTGQPVMLEAQGDSYTDYARVSANTGLPTVLGWTVHEWLWRGSYDIPAPRITDVKTVYETKDSTLAKQLLHKYNIQYVFIGALEFQKYPALDEAKFKQLGRLVFQNGNTRIYRIM